MVRIVMLVWVLVSVACVPASSGAPPDVVVVVPDAGGAAQPEASADCATASAINQARMIRAASDAALAPVLVVPCP